MSVYVDPLVDFGWVLRGHRVKNCHMFADTLDELHALASTIGMKRSWFQPSPPASIDHYDLTPGRRAAAVAAGAIELGRLDAVNWRRAQRGLPLVGERPGRAT